MHRTRVAGSSARRRAGLFLDEVEALPIRGQVSLLRFLQDASFRSIGEEQTRHADVRVVAASNVKLYKLVERGEFREDLLFRLDVLSVDLPPLRDRISDLALLAPHFLDKAALAAGGEGKRLSAGAMELLSRHRWPGNVRELEHVLLRAHLCCVGSVIEADDLRKASPALGRLEAANGTLTTLDRSGLRRQKMLAVVEVERRFVEQALAQTNGNISAAARLCGIERAAFSRMAKRHATLGGLMEFLSHDWLDVLAAMPVWG
jgi:two-component system, NtrC family, response regulator GlrR